ncbi:NIPSNAP family protein [Glacieibacterium frigidum]|uniref:NIPSNAP family protein n=1 Tax=Glacieibacterium frigidum TaxID=2593303 RepID=A0A552UET4_9SPHN|nr:NIPSNAP family protein [Glacieibacterium frigidum]TRW16713.1 NIPSNAP family protein [Glacieibacterium frigidum]
MICELRVYEAMPGRLAALHRRFETITLPIWARLGIRPLGFWTTMVGSSNNALMYLLAWQSLAEREAVWDGFLADPEWIRLKAETEVDGILVRTASNELLVPTSYSPGMAHAQFEEAI